MFRSNIKSELAIVMQLYNPSSLRQNNHNAETDAVSKNKIQNKKTLLYNAQFLLNAISILYVISPVFSFLI